jgi:hypothetical protein
MLCQSDLAMPAGASFDAAGCGVFPAGESAASRNEPGNVETARRRMKKRWMMADIGWELVHPLIQGPSGEVAGPVKKILSPALQPP